ncbi:hypothetical protein RMP42_05816 [Roseomonas mucosa]|nr:hypothetical protein RMP42_05816 [Roseomonas mucosa]
MDELDCPHLTAQTCAMWEAIRKDDYLRMARSYGPGPSAAGRIILVAPWDMLGVRRLFLPGFRAEERIN